MFSAGLRPLVSLRALGMRTDSLHGACSPNLWGQLLGLSPAWDHPHSASCWLLSCGPGGKFLHFSGLGFYYSALFPELRTKVVTQRTTPELKVGNNNSHFPA